MENLTHSLLGAAMAELALPLEATAAQRRLFYTASVIASNLPDADLLYTRITPAPLGYMLHHRGHTHTLVGLVGQGLLIALVCLYPAIRQTAAPVARRFWVLVAAALLSHLVLDSWNSYGVHPFYPVDSRWYFGDAVFIFEPWLWLFLGVAAAANTRNRAARLGIAGLIIALPLGLTYAHLIPIGALLAMGVVGVPLVWTGRSSTPRARSAVALVCVALFVAGSFVLSGMARRQAIATLDLNARGHVVDVVLNSNPSNPMCWSALAIAEDERAGEYTLQRGTIAPLSRLLPRPGCAGGVGWQATVHQSLTELRRRAEDDCWVRAWLQFGRAPVIEDGAIFDLRFGGFTSMRLRPPGTSGCPARLTHWGMPRADLLSASP